MLYRVWIRDRPYLSVKWDIEELRVDQKAEGAVIIVNNGNTEATLYAKALDCDFVPQIPAQFDHKPLLSKTVKGIRLAPKEECPWKFVTPHLGTARMKGLRNQGSDPVVLYAVVYVEFNKFLWSKRWIRSEVVYDMRKGKFRAVSDTDRRQD
jgi:hypothetical protein